MTPTRAAARSMLLREHHDDLVARRRVLIAGGTSAREIDAHCAAGRWQRFGQAIVLHSGPVTGGQRASVALANVGARGALTSFTALREAGLTGWERASLHVLVPFGARVTRPNGFTIVAHQVDWDSVHLQRAGRLHRTEDAVALAAESFDQPRSAIGLCAALVQQRLVTAEALVDVLERRARHRHRSILIAVLGDIAAGSHSVAEIDFIALCRRERLPEPVRQSPRRDARGRIRWLDVEWRRPDGSRVVAEIDGGLHTKAAQWWDDQSRQNEVSLGHTTTVLRFPSMVVRLVDPVMLDQLRRALLP